MVIVFINRKRLNFTLEFKQFKTIINAAVCVCVMIMFVMLHIYDNTLLLWCCGVNYALTNFKRTTNLSADNKASQSVALTGRE